MAMRTGPAAVLVALPLVLGALGLGATAVSAYDVQPGDTLSAVSRRTPEPVAGAAARRLLAAAAREQGLSPSFVLAVSLWESGWNQTMVSPDGAIGLMQILPATGEWAGPSLLGAAVDIFAARDNARL